MLFLSYAWEAPEARRRESGSAPYDGPPRRQKERLRETRLFRRVAPAARAECRTAPKAKGWPYDPKLRKLFERRYLRELATGDNSRLLDLLAALSKNANFSLGCYCEDETICHRSILRKVLISRGR
jgi:uncharacterized protein YeaO (DUF488 family)